MFKQESAYKTFKLTPDRTVENKKGHEFTRALHDFLFRPWYKRLRVKQRKMEQIERVWYTIRLTSEEISFHITASSNTETLLKQRLTRYWPKAAVVEENLPAVPNKNTATAEMKYRRHNIFALDADWREDTVPISSIMNAVRDMKVGDDARVVVCIEAYNRMTWADWSEKAYDEFKKGKTPQRRGIGGRFNIKNAGKLIDGVMTEASEMVEALLEGQEEAKLKDRARRKKHQPDLEKKEIMLDGKLLPTTNHKRNEPVFKTHIFITSHSSDISRRTITLRALGNAFSELTGDNELKRVDHKRNASSRTVELINEWRTPLGWDANIMSATETGKLFQLPTASLQDEYKEWLKMIEHRETNMPAILTSDGIKIGTVRFKATENAVYLPIEEWDELCLPRIVIGGMGTGKTTGYGGNFGAHAVARGFTVFSIDVAKDELNDEIAFGTRKLGVPEEKTIRLKFGEKAYRLDWCEAYGNNAPRAANRLAGEAINFFNLHGREAGIETSRYIRLAGKTIGETQGTMKDMMDLFLDPDFRNKTVARLKNEQLKKEWSAYEKLSDGMKGKVTDPILNRIDLLTGDEYLRECLESVNGLDFTKWITGGYHVGIHIPQRDLGREAVDVLVDFLMAKIELAMFARPEEEQIPAFVILDEPHQFLSAAERWKRMAVETRKWRLGLVWMFHSWEQIPKDLAEIVKAAGSHYHIYTSSKTTYKSLAEELKPFDIEEAMKTPRHSAINVIRAGGVTVEPFMAEMAAPPSKWKRQTETA